MVLNNSGFKTSSIFNLIFGLIMHFKLYQPRTSLFFVTLRSLMVAAGILLLINYVFPGFLNNRFLEEYTRLITLIVNLIAIILFSRNISYKFVGKLIYNDEKIRFSFGNKEMKLNAINRISVLPRKISVLLRGNQLAVCIPQLSNEEFSLFLKNNLESESFQKLLTNMNKITAGKMESNFIWEKVFTPK